MSMILNDTQISNFLVNNAEYISEDNNKLFNSVGRNLYQELLNKLTLLATEHQDVYNKCIESLVRYDFDMDTLISVLMSTYYEVDDEFDTYENMSMHLGLYDGMIIRTTSANYKFIVNGKEEEYDIPAIWLVTEVTGSYVFNQIVLPLEVTYDSIQGFFDNFSTDSASAFYQISSHVNGMKDSSNINSMLNTKNYIEKSYLKVLQDVFAKTYADGEGVKYEGLLTNATKNNDFMLLTPELKNFTSFVASTGNGFATYKDADTLYMSILDSKLTYIQDLYNDILTTTFTYRTGVDGTTVIGPNSYMTQMVKDIIKKPIFLRNSLNSHQYDKFDFYSHILKKRYTGLDNSFIQKYTKELQNTTNSMNITIMNEVINYINMSDNDIDKPLFTFDSANSSIKGDNSSRIKIDLVSTSEISHLVNHAADGSGIIKGMSVSIESDQVDSGFLYGTIDMIDGNTVTVDITDMGQEAKDLSTVSTANGEVIGGFFSMVHLCDAFSKEVSMNEPYMSNILTGYTWVKNPDDVTYGTYNSTPEDGTSGDLILVIEGPVYVPYLYKDGKWINMSSKLKVTDIEEQTAVYADLASAPVCTEENKGAFINISDKLHISNGEEWLDYSIFNEFKENDQARDSYSNSPNSLAKFSFMDITDRLMIRDTIFSKFYKDVSMMSEYIDTTHGGTLYSQLKDYFDKIYTLMTTIRQYIIDDRQYYLTGSVVKV